MRQHVCMYARAKNVLPSWIEGKEMEEGERTGEGGRGIRRRWGRGSSEEGGGPESVTLRNFPIETVPTHSHYSCAFSLSPLSFSPAHSPSSPLLYIPFRRRFIRQQMRLRQWRARNHTIKRGLTGGR